MRQRPIRDLRLTVPLRGKTFTREWKSLRGNSSEYAWWTALTKISAQSDGWTNDTARDFTSNEWTDLEQIGGTSFTEAEVSLAEDLGSADQMRGARAALQESANDTADHVGLLIRRKEQLANHKLEMEQWMAQHGQKEWFK